MILRKNTSAAIYYHPDGYDTSRHALVGRRAAGASFLRGFLRHGQPGDLWALVDDPAHVQGFADLAIKCGRTEGVRVIEASSMGQIGQAGMLYYPSPTIAKLAWQRSFHGHGAWSLCGLFHATSTAAVMDAITGLLTAPIYPWDALICPSTAVRNNVLSVMQAQADFLSERLAATRMVVPSLPVIPIGIDAEEFAFTDDAKGAARARLGIPAKARVVLYLGRKNFSGKINPVPLYQILERLASQMPEDEPLVLIECGWAPTPYYDYVFSAAAAALCARLKVVCLDGREANRRALAWSAADIFCSLSDNIQESFGITPLEAKAAGLPVIVSDWDGYRDSVREGVDGFLIPTIVPPPGFGRDLAMRLGLDIDTDGHFGAYVSSFVALDQGRLEQALMALLDSEPLRRRMGNEGRRHARIEYDWAVVIPQYEALWRELRERRQTDSGKAQVLDHPWPARMDPFESFSSYASRVLALNALLMASIPDPQAMVKTLCQLDCVNFAASVLPTESEIDRVLQALLDNGAMVVGQLLALFPSHRRARVFRSLVWLMKYNVIREAL